MQKSKYYFCYSKALHKYLHNKKKIPYICAALHEDTLAKFWLYERTPELEKSLAEYKEFMSC